MLILSAGELQIRPNGSVRTGLSERVCTGGCWRETGRIPSLQCGRIANSPERVRPNGFVRTGLSVRLLDETGRIPSLQCGRIANSPERGMDGFA